MTFDDPSDRRADPATINVRLRAAVGPARTVAGWATVELDRAERELRAALATSTAPGVDAPADELLGAGCRLVGLRDASQIVLLEPSTEGPLAAALARHGEGWLVRWLLVDASAVARVIGAGHRLSREAPGPLGRERLVLDDSRSGPFVLLTELEAAMTPDGED